MTGRCTLPPAGWWCSLGPDHTGPCAADLDAPLIKVADQSVLTPSAFDDELFLKSWMTMRHKLLRQDVATRQLGPVSDITVSHHEADLTGYRPVSRWAAFLERLGLRRPAPPVVMVLVRLEVWCVPCTCRHAQPGHHVPGCPAGFPLEEHRRAQARRERLEAGHHVLVVEEDGYCTIECPNRGPHLPCGAWEVCGCDVPLDEPDGDPIDSAYDWSPCPRTPGQQHSYDGEFYGEMVVSGSTCWPAQCFDIAETVVQNLGGVPPGRHEVEYASEDGELVLSWPGARP